MKKRVKLPVILECGAGCQWHEFNPHGMVHVCKLANQVITREKHWPNDKGFDDFPAWCPLPGAKIDLE